MLKFTYVFIGLIIVSFSFGQEYKNYSVLHESKDGRYYIFINKRGETTLKLKQSNYEGCYSDTMEYFAVVGLKGQPNWAWWAIDKNKKPLFRVYNTAYHDIHPDELHDGMIRIVDEKKKTEYINAIGYANAKGQIVIQPQFEMATPFYKGVAIVGSNCKVISDTPEGVDIRCSTTGYIDKKGTVTWMGAATFEEVKKKTGWQYP